MNCWENSELELNESIYTKTKILASENKQVNENRLSSIIATQLNTRKAWNRTVQ
jgi:hypothetical protein